MAGPVKSQWDFGELFPPEATRKVLTVAELTAQVKRLLEKQVGQVWVTGEVTNLRAQSSGHVYFTLKDNSADAKKKLVAACKKYLSGHEGEVFYAAGTLAESLKRQVNDRDFDVALHIVFKDMASYEKYAVAKRHTQFIDENKDSLKTVRVFDSIVER